jgi:fumarate reductase flavoprotein subunit
MAGLVCAARARELGLRPRLVEKGDRPGGSMLLSSCVIWRHTAWDDFRAECPGGDPALQRLIWDRLDDALDWLVSLGAEPVWDDTENPRTTGKRFDPRALTRLLARDVELETPLPEDAEGPVVLATGGFPKRLAEQHGLLLRANPWSDGAGLDFACARGAGVTGGMEEFYGRAMPAPPAAIREEDFVPLSQLYGRWARVFTDDGREITPPSVAWHENDLAQTIGAGAWYVLDDAGLEHARERVEAARAAGGTVVAPSGLPFETPPGSRVAVHVAAAVTHTLGGLRVDTHARAADGIWAAGVDAGGVATGGYASGLAQALVLGLAAAEDIAG